MGTQLRLRSAKLLIINLGAVGMEIVKNLVLGGISSVEILDNSVIKEEDFAAQFFLPNDDEVIGQMKLPHVIDDIKELNNRVDIKINTSDYEELLENDSEFFKQFDLIIGTELEKPQIIKLNQLTRNFNIPMYVTGLHGMFGYIINDLIEHVSENSKDIGNQLRKPNTPINLHKLITDVKYDKSENKEVLTIKDSYPSIKEIFTSKKLKSQLNKRQFKRLSPTLPLIMSLFEFDRNSSIDEDILRQKLIETCEILDIPPSVITDDYLNVFINQKYTEFAPTSAILGGCLAQDIIQYFGRKESPINNVLILDGIRSEMPIYTF